MADRIDRAHRSWNMSRIRGKNTRPEIVVRSLLHRLGFRFRLHVKEMPGKPDIVLPRYRTAIFVNGCFWHRHARCKFAYMPKSRVRFWTAKFEETRERDKRTYAQLRLNGWKVVTIWECSINRTPLLTRKLLAIRKS